MDRKKAYSEKLRDPRWQKLRLQVFERDGWACQLCGAKDKTLNVHHMVYRRGAEPWDYPLNLLLTLCEDCHQGESYERKQQAVTGLIEALAVRGAHAETITALTEWVLKAGQEVSKVGCVEFDEVIAALRFHTTHPDFIPGLVGAYYDYGPWCEGSSLSIVYAEKPRE